MWHDGSVRWSLDCRVRLYSGEGSRSPMPGAACVGGSDRAFLKASKSLRKRAMALRPLRVLRSSAVERLGQALCRMCREALCRMCREALCRMCREAVCSSQSASTCIPSESPACPCGEPMQSRSHVLADCERHDAARHHLLEASSDLSTASIIGTRKGLTALARFLKDSDAFVKTQPELLTPATPNSGPDGDTQE
jgi:HEAT repeat protein